MTYSAASLEWARSVADLPYWQADRRQALAEVAEVVAMRGATPVASWMPDRMLCHLADERAELMQREVFALCEPMAVLQSVAWLNARVQHLQGAPFTWGAQRHGGAPSPAELEAMFARAQCRLWWRRQLRRLAARMLEREAIVAGKVGNRCGAVYCTDAAVKRRQAAAERDRAMLEATKIESEDGEVITLAQAVDASTANPAIRRGELMTRIAGCERIAKALGWVGIFTTNTAPSRFHHRLWTGEANPRADGTDGPMQPNMPRDAQAWLRKTWARTRATLHRRGVSVFGFRMVEPHHDGCPHWHMILWAPAMQVQALAATMRDTWLEDHGDEPGASEHRFDFVELESGKACHYAAKYVAKGIDDEGAVGEEGHVDEVEGRKLKLAAAKAKRITAWASTHGIRQFQAIGQPPVTAWRELRRLDEAAVEGATPAIRQAYEAAHRRGDARACWFTYVRAQGGVCQGRDYRIRVAMREETREGRYGDVQALRPIGVRDVARPLEVVPSSRRTWKPAGTWRRVSAPAPLAATYADACASTPWQFHPLTMLADAVDLERTPAEAAAALRRAQRAALGPVSLTVRGALEGSRARGPLRTWLQRIEHEPGAVHSPLEPPDHGTDHHPDPGSSLRPPEGGRSRGRAISADALRRAWSG